jgi:hypothetical protein
VDKLWQVAARPSVTVNMVANTIADMETIERNLDMVTSRRSGWP